MNLNVTEGELKSPNLDVPVLSSPSRSAARIGTDQGIMIAKAPLHVDNGYAEVLWFNGRPGWIAANMLSPYHSQANPNAKCVPSLLSDGRPGFCP